jgi:hypothetical protein
MPVSYRDQFLHLPPDAPSGPRADQAAERNIVDWQAGAPVFEGEVRAEPAVATEIAPGLALILKPGDIVCDWLGVAAADSRGLVRLFVNLTLYGKLAIAIAYFAS